MPRASRKDTEGNYFHIMVQGIGKEYVFPDDNCKGFFLKCLKENKDIYPVNILAFCVMENHAHILVSVKDSLEMSQYFRRVNADYARYYNRIHNRSGYVFRDRFKSQTITSERQLCYCMAYIQNNPLKANMVQRAEDYLYSSYTNYLRGTGIIDFDEAAKFFDISPENVTAIMQERTLNEWLEHDDKEYESKHKVFEELKKRYDLSNNAIIKDDKLVIKIFTEMKERTNLSQREFAEIFNINREILRKLISKS